MPIRLLPAAVLFALFGLLCALLTPIAGRPVRAQPASEQTFPEYVNTSGRALPILEGSSGQPVLLDGEPWLLQPGERFFSLPWGDDTRFRWGDRAFHYLGTIGGSRFRFFLVEDWGPTEPVQWIAPLDKSGAPQFEITNRAPHPVPVIDGQSGRKVSFGNDPWVIAPGETILSHAWTEGNRFVLEGRPYHFIGTAGSTSFFNFFVTPDDNYGVDGCANDWTITFYGVADENSFGGRKVPVVTADQPAVPVSELSAAFLADAALQGTGLGRGFGDGVPRYLTVQRFARDPAGTVMTATVKIVPGPLGRSGPVEPWQTAAAPADLAYRWRHAPEGPFTRLTVKDLGPARLPDAVTSRLVGQTFSVTDSGGHSALAPTNHHLDVYIGPLDYADPTVQAIFEQGVIRNSTVCVGWP